MNSNTLCALFIGIDPNRAATLTSAFHRLGYICRHTMVEEMGKLGSAIRDDSPDLVLFDESQSALELNVCLQAISNQQLDLPIILLSESDERLPDHQIVDILPPDKLERAARSCLREFWAFQSRRALAHTRQELQAAEHRSEQILLQAEEPIAYVADGMIVSVNRLFAEYFGFSDPDELDCQPVIDLIEDDDQDRLKSALRSVTPSDSARVTLQGRKTDGDSVEMSMKLSHAVLDEEDCVQLTLHKESEDGASNVAAIDTNTGFALAMRFVQQLEDVAAHGFGGNAQGTFVLISLDRYSQLRADHGYSGCSVIMRDLAAALMAEFPKGQFGRIDGDLVGILLSNTTADEVLERAEKFCASVAQRPVTIGDNSINYTVTIAIHSLGKSKQTSGVAMVNNLIGLCEQVREEAGSNGIGNDAALYVRAKQQLNQQSDPLQAFEDAKTDNRLQLHYQPIVSLADEEKQYYEVCLSLKDRESDEISGAELLENFERQGKSTELDRWIIVEATKQLSQSRQAGKNTRLVINVSGNVFHDKNLCSWLGVAMKAAGLPGDTLVLQVNAATAGKAIKPAKAFITKLRDLGGNIALRSASPGTDDAAALKQLQPLLTKLELSPKESDTLQEAITATQEAGSKAVVTGVESAATLATLWQLKPDYVQGSYIHSPSSEMDYDFGAD